MKTFKNFNFLPILIAVALSLLVKISLAKDIIQPKYAKVELKGNKNGKPIVLIPGLACSGAVWDETVQQLEKEYACHVFTMPGFAGVPPLQSTPILQIMRDDIVQYIKDNELKEVTLIGHSLGGFLSMWISFNNPEVVQKVILVDALPFLAAIYRPDATEESMKEPALAMQKQMMEGKGTREEIIAQQRKNMKTLIRDSVYIEKTLEWSIKSDKNTVATAMYEMYTNDLRDELKTVKIPTLVLGGAAFSKQYNIPYETAYNNYDSQFKGMPNYTLAINTDSQHFIMYDAPDWFYQQVKDFLKK